MEKARLKSLDFGHTRGQNGTGDYAWVQFIVVSEALRAGSRSRPQGFLLKTYDEVFTEPRKYMDAPCGTVDKSE